MSIFGHGASDLELLGAISVSLMGFTISSQRKAASEQDKGMNHQQMIQITRANNVSQNEAAISPPQTWRGQRSKFFLVQILFVRSQDITA